jgi:hypothetical protein
MNSVPEKPSLAAVLAEAISLAAQHKGGTDKATFTDAMSLSAVGQTLNNLTLDLPHLLAEAALVAFRRFPGMNPRNKRQSLRFIVADKRPAADLQYAEDGGTPWSFTPAVAFCAAEQANVTLELAHDVLGMNGIPFYELLGTRNLGSFVGAVYGYSLQREMPDRLMVNGHQDGYPDLCALTTEGQKYVAQLRAEGMEAAKKSWALYPHGGIEIKTTCGAVPPPTKKRKKPGIGDQRSGMLTGADWKAHHRETNRLLGLLWDFIDGVPTVIGLFYRNDLTEADWGAVIVPTSDEAFAEVADVEAGLDAKEVVVDLAVEAPEEDEVETEDEDKPKKRKGRTTSVSIMTGAAVKKMGHGWVVLPADRDLLAAIGRPRIFDLGVADVEPLTSSLPAEAREVLAALDEERKQQQQAASAKGAKTETKPDAGRKK